VSPENPLSPRRFFRRMTAILGRNGVYSRSARCAQGIFDNSVSEFRSGERVEGMERQPKEKDGRAGLRWDERGKKESAKQSQTILAQSVL
jgi:hypothetical protein